MSRAASPDLGLPQSVLLRALCWNRAVRRRLSLCLPVFVEFFAVATSAGWLVTTSGVMGVWSRTTSKKFVDFCRLIGCSAFVP